MKKQLKGRHFSSDAVVIAAAETWLDGQYSHFFLVACKIQSLVAVACFFLDGLRTYQHQGTYLILFFNGLQVYPVPFPPFLHFHLYLNYTLVRRTTGRKL